MLEQIVEFDAFEDGDVECILVSGATFKDDFGPFKKGEFVDSLKLDYSHSRLVEYDVDGNEARSVHVKLIVAE